MQSAKTYTMNKPILLIRVPEDCSEQEQENIKQSTKSEVGEDYYVLVTRSPVNTMQFEIVA
ncbi:MAG: hypothetical protein JWP88_1576 [Flaviaesturariibacter sp.]|nr:hypothetical protein [Flaviaesturariibacter sp.]